MVSHQFVVITNNHKDRKFARDMMMILQNRYLKDMINARRLVGFRSLMHILVSAVFSLCVNIAYKQSNEIVNYLYDFKCVE